MVPECSKRELEERWIMMLTSALHTLARYQTALHADTLPAPLPALLEELVVFLTGGIQASAAQLRPKKREKLAKSARH
jgi:hypothetical protein